MKIKRNIILTAFLLIIMVFGTLTGCSRNIGNTGNSEKAVTMDEPNDKPKKDYSNIVENPNIAIPGYEGLSFKAGKKKQSVGFYNPKENTCYFRMSLVLKSDDEGTDGDTSKEEVLWTSELIEPGEEIKTIELSKELESGEYTATLKYECFSLKDKTPLNGSDIELTLTVR